MYLIHDPTCAFCLCNSTFLGFVVYKCVCNVLSLKHDLTEIFFPPYILFKLI